MTARAIASNILKVTMPRLYWKRKVNYYQSHFSEMEMYLLPLLCDPSRTSLDIGGAIGVYTANMFDKSKDVITFEPIPSNVKLISDMIRNQRMNARVMPFALSDHAGTAMLKMVDGDTGLSTLEKENDLANGQKNVNAINVEIKQLDDFQFRDIGFIKIDVEGHEAAVLQGARATIIHSKPHLLVEIEERHKHGAVNECVSYLSALGYRCFCILNKQLIPYEQFNLVLHQDTANLGTTEDNFKRKGIYINNFIFVNDAEADVFTEKAQELLRQLQA